MASSSSGAIVNYTAMSLTGVMDEFRAIAEDTRTVFGSLSEGQLNWRPDETRWSVAQCFDHLLVSNALMFKSMDGAIAGRRSPTFWQRVPLLPRIHGWMLVKTQSPQASRRFTAPQPARPAMSAIGRDVIDRFIACQHEAIGRIQSLGDRDADRIMVSPFASFITYSVRDGYRIIAAHQRRHFEQARRVRETPRFPSGE